MDLTQLWIEADLAFSLILSITLLVMLLAMARLSREVRLLQYQVSVIDSDLKLIGEGLKMIAGREKPDPERVRPIEED